MRGTGRKRVGNKGRGTRQGKKVHARGKIQVMHLKFFNFSARPRTENTKLKSLLQSQIKLSKEMQLCKKPPFCS